MGDHTDVQGRSGQHVNQEMSAVFLSQKIDIENERAQEVHLQAMGT